MLRPIQDIYKTDDYPELLVGLGDPDDAAAWRLDDKRALVITTDFFTPVVDEAYDYGAIAAANSLSDAYAMGARPFLALNITALPAKLPPKIASDILRGGAEKAREAGVVIAGGHTITDEDPKYGLVVLGFAEISKMMTKGGAHAGDALVMSKPIGFGVTTTAIKQQKAAPKDVEEVVRWMSKLNKTAAELALEFGVRGATDITGFSLLGHAHEMAETSGVGLRFSMAQIPLISCARKYAEMWTFPGGSSDNRLYFGKHVTFAEGIPEESQMLLFDAQTSGGLLLSVPSEKLNDLLARAKELEQPLWHVGDVVDGAGIHVSK
ncbi:MAG: selenide, water dikinase SelD [Anaerolineales bacterium]|nr:selenide, water dikinase SelD [Anaerolineales bacterium]